MTRLASFVPVGTFLLSIYCIIIICRHHQLPPPLTSTATCVKGPNDVVWAVTSPRDPMMTKGTRDATTTASPPPQYLTTTKGADRRWLQRKWAQTTRSASFVPVGTFIFFLLIILNLANVLSQTQLVFYEIRDKEGYERWLRRKRARTTQDVSFGTYVRVFFDFYIFQLMFNCKCRFYSTKYEIKRGMEGRDNENGPKRHKMRRLGHM